MAESKLQNEKSDYEINGDELEVGESGSRAAPINLRPYQTEHVRDLVHRLKSNPALLDYTVAGLGKTVTTTAISSITEREMIVFAPGIVLDEWREKERIYGAQILDYISYPELVGKEGYKLKHDYLERRGKTYVPTDKLRWMIARGVMFVFDETSSTKSKTSLTYKAVHTIVTEVVRSQSRARVMHLSALPRGQMDEIQTLCQVLGIVLSENYWVYDNQHGYILSGIVELIKWCKVRKPIDTLNVLSKHMRGDYYSESVVAGVDWVLRPEQLVDMSKWTIPNLVAALFDAVVQSELCCQAIDNPDDRPPIKNVFYRVYSKETGHDQADLSLLSLGSDILESAVNDRRKMVHKEVKRGFRLSSESLLRVAYYIVRDGIEKEPNRKFVIGAWYRSQIKWLEQALYKYGVRTLYGDVSKEQRSVNISLFQADNNECQVIVVNPTVGGAGLNLDDRIGTRPRSLLMLHGWQYHPYIQMPYRIWRETTKSKDRTHIHTLSSPSFRRHAQILSMLIERSGAARTIIKGSKLMLPSDYESVDQDIYIERHDDLPPLPSDNDLEVIKLKMAISRLTSVDG